MNERSHNFARGLKILLVLTLVLAPLAWRNAAAHRAHDPLLETGGASKLKAKDAAPAEIKIVSYNMRYRGGEELHQLIELLRDDEQIGRAAIIGLQEVDRRKARTQKANTARLMAERLEMNYAWAAPPQAEGKEKEEEETGVAILSPYPLTDVTRIVLPNEGPGGRRRVALGVTVLLGDRRLRVYSVHAETRTGNTERLEQFKAVLEDLKRYQAKRPESAAVVLGDFNTITGDAVRGTTKLFTAEDFSTPFPEDLSTWHTFILELKLDWLWLRDLTATDHGINKEINLSDHWPLWVWVKLKR